MVTFISFGPDEPECQASCIVRGGARGSCRSHAERAFSTGLPPPATLHNHANQHANGLPESYGAPGVHAWIFTRYFPRDWRGFERLRLDLFLAGGNDEPITVVVADEDYTMESNGLYSRTFSLEPGLNEISIAIEEIIQAPPGRTMHPGSIAHLGLSAANISEEVTLYMDNIRLVRAEAEEEATE